MADLYSQSASYAQPPSRSTTYPTINTSQGSSVYPSSSSLVPSHSSSQHSSQHTASAHSSTPGGNVTDEHEDPETPPKSGSAETSPTENKPATKTQSTFLTKLYSLLEKPENHHMIRWDPAGDHIIVERPEQLALHVLPSVYRQSRFASFSRQLNIYGFMRKVNLRNVDPAIDDPDASTWSHPTLNRHSPPEVVANFKRRVPPRLPKPRKRQEPEMPQLAAPRSAIGMAPVPLTVPTQLGSPGSKQRTRAFTTPGSFGPIGSGWGPYPRSSLPPLTVPSDPPALAHSGLYAGGSHSAHPSLHSHAHSGHPMASPTDDTQSGFSPASYGSTQASLVSASQYGGYSTGGTDSTNSWSFSPNSAASSSHSSLSQLLNPSGANSQAASGQYSARSSIGSAYGSASAASFMQNHNHSTSSLSPDSRPTTSYSVSSMSSLPYETESSSAMGSHSDYSRPGSSHHRPLSPGGRHAKPSVVTSGLGQLSSAYSSTSSLSMGVAGGGSAIRRARRHSNAMSPYPSPYDQGTSHIDTSVHHSAHQRPSTSPQPLTPGAQTSYTYNPSGTGASDYGYGSSHHHSSHAHGNGTAHHGHGHQQSPQMHSSASGGTGHLSNVNGLDWERGGVRPSTSTSSLSAASHASSSQANTPPVDSAYGTAGGEDINRFSPDFGYAHLNEGIQTYAKVPELVV